MDTGRFGRAIVPATIFVVVCLAVGFLTAFFTDSFVAIAIAGVVAGSVARLISDAVRRKDHNERP